ncbi:protein serine/threonine phosphatase 2C [Panus rudis PR-1116 ss-1]|nr:protein serine/threonine phosphatase 2C [Panus rudis PR-1116 ss-1]
MALRLLQRPPLSRSGAIHNSQRVARYHDYIRFATPGGTARIPLHNPKIIGVASTRGNRSYQEDFYSYAALSLNPAELQRTLKKARYTSWDPSELPSVLARQVLFVGIYDGHGGSTVSQFLRQELHGLLESADKAHVPDVYAWVKAQEGYFRRFTGGALAPWVRPDGKDAQQEMDLEARATLAFFEVDKGLETEAAANECGATASVVLLQSLDIPPGPFFTSNKLALTIAHVGDTRVLLTSIDGKVATLTEKHHADARVEAVRLRRMMGSGLITDSFGEARWMGALENTRSLGDLKWKPYGVTPEPQVETRILDGPNYSHITLISDGISSVASDDEISDLARGACTPRDAAQRVVSYAEEMGSEDNLTAIVVPLAGWGKIRGEDRTKELRAYRRQQMVGSERQRRM